MAAKNSARGSGQMYPLIMNEFIQQQFAEIGIDMSRFATPGHLLSWACLCPRNDESAGKRRSTRLRRGGKWLKTTLVQAAWAAVKVKGGYLQAQFHRLRARRGAKKVIIGVAGRLDAHRRLAHAAQWH